MIQKNKIIQKQEEQKTIQEKKKQLKPLIDKERMANFIKSKIYHSQDPQTFDQQLQKQIDQVYEKIQSDARRQFYRKQKIKLIEQNNLKYRQQWKQKLQKKLSQSQKNKEKIIKTRVKKASEKRQVYHQLAMKKYTQINKKQLSESVKKINKFYQSLPEHRLSQPNISKNQSYTGLVKKQRKQALQEQLNNRLRELAQKKKVFEIPKFQHKPINLNPVSPKATEKDRKIKDSLDTMLINLQKIQAARKKKDFQMRKMIYKKKVRQNNLNDIINARLKQLKQKDNNKQKQLTLKQKIKNQSVLMFKQSKNSNIFSSRKSLSNVFQRQKDYSIQFIQEPKKKSKSYKKEIHENIKSYATKQLKLKLSLQ